MNSKTVKPNPIYFSDYFKVDKTKLKELGVFDPILNFDTKLFVDPILLKSSKTEIFQKARERYVDFFNNLLKLLKKTKSETDMFWRSAKIKAKFSEYKYTCIGYGDDSIDGSGPGPSFSDKLLESAKEIIKVAQEDSEMFLLLPLLEDGMGADGISDMTQSIIDENICQYTQFIMKELGLNGEIEHISREGNRYKLLKNPHSKSVLKLLPQDILADLPLADTFHGWLVEATETNPILRKKVNDDIGSEWFDRTKKDKKESLLNKLKDDEELFVEVLSVLKESSFEPYDVEVDHRGIHRWLKDSEKFITERTPNSVPIKDSLDAINELIQTLVSHFKDLIENKNMKGLFWADVKGTHKHVNEFYSQMLFFMVSKMWLTSQNSNVDVSYGKIGETDQFNLRFTISGPYAVLVQIKHANNTSLQVAFEKNIEYIQGDPHLRSIIMILNFKEKEASQLKEIKRKQFEGCSLVEIYTQLDQPDLDGFNAFSDIEMTDFKVEENDFNNAFVDLEDFDWSFDDNYKEEKRRGGQQRHQHTTSIKQQIVKPMFLNKDEIKGPSVKYRAKVISDKLCDIGTMTDDQIQVFSEKYALDFEILNASKPYFLPEKERQIYDWCRAIDKGIL